MKPRLAAIRYPKSWANDAELLELRRKAWRQQGVAVIDVAAIGDDWIRQAVANLATELYGPRVVPASQRDGVI